MKHVRERRICGESAAILNIKADGMWFIIFNPEL